MEKLLDWLDCRKRAMSAGEERLSSLCGGKKGMRGQRNDEQADQLREIYLVVGSR
jgi:hypothetical protein